MNTILSTLLLTVLINSGVDKDDKNFYVDVIETGNSEIPLAIQCTSYLRERFLLYHADEKKFKLHQELQPIQNENYHFIPLKNRFVIITGNGLVRVFASFDDLAKKRTKPEKKFKLFLFPDEGKETYVPEFDLFHTFVPISDDEIIVSGHNSVGPNELVFGLVSVKKGDWLQRYETFFDYFELARFEFDGKYLRVHTSMALTDKEPYEQAGYATRLFSFDIIQKEIIYDMKWYRLPSRHHVNLPKGRLLHVFEENEELKMNVFSKKGSISETKIIPNYVYRKEHIVRNSSVYIKENNSFLCLFAQKDLRMVNVDNPKVQKKIEWPFSEECNWEDTQFKYLSVDGSERKRIVFVYQNKIAFLDLDLWKIERIDNFPTHDQIFGKD